jgi:hypothetical protein
MAYGPRRRPRRPLINPLSSVPRAALLLRSAAFFVLVVAAAAILFVLPPVPTIAVIQANTEFVSYDVAVPDLAQLRLAGYALTFESPGDSNSLMKSATSPTARKPLCLAGILTPTTGARVSYKRIDSGPIAVVIERTDEKPAATFALATGEAPAALQKASWIRLETPTGDDDKPACPGAASKRLPIYGATRIGTPLRPEGAGEESSSGVLIEGTIDLYAKTIELGRWRDGLNRIYPTTVSLMDIPPGAQVSEFLEKGDMPTPWAGFVKLNSDQAFDIRITTTANRIQILRPGIGIQPETLATGLFAQLTNDPVILSLQVFAVLLFSVLQAASSWIVAKDANTMTRLEVADAKAQAPLLQEAPAAPLAEPPTAIATNQQASDPPAKNQTGG